MERLHHGHVHHEWHCENSKRGTFTARFGGEHRGAASESTIHDPTHLDEFETETHRAMSINQVQIFRTMGTNEALVAVVDGIELEIMQEMASYCDKTCCQNE